MILQVKSIFLILFCVLSQKEIFTSKNSFLTFDAYIKYTMKKLSVPYENPIIYADYSDPDAIRLGEDYYLTASSFCNAPGLPILHSKDLVHWEIISYALPRIPGNRYDRPVHGCGVWAPAIRFHEGLFYIYFPMPDEGIFVITAKEPEGPWSEPVNIYPGAGHIDPCPFWDEDGKAYLIYGVAKSRIGYKSILYIREMSPDGLKLIGPETKVFDGNENGQETIEGPKLYKRNGYYYVFAPAGGVKPGWQLVLRSREIYGPYDYRVCLSQGATKVNGPHQGAWVDNGLGDDYFLHFQDVYSAGRLVHLQPMRWENDWPLMGTATACESAGTCGEPVVKGTVYSAASEPYFLPTSQDFRGSASLGLQWQWNANPRPDFCESSESGLILKALSFGAASPEKVPYADLPNLLLQKWPAPQFSSVSLLDLSQLKQGEEAGIISLGTDYGVLSAVRAEEGFLIKSVKGHQIFGNINAEKTEELSEIVGEIKEAEIRELYFRLDVKRTGTQSLGPDGDGFPREEVTFSYSPDGDSYREAFRMEAKPGRWVGAKFGVFARGF